MAALVDTTFWFIAPMAGWPPSKRIATEILRRGILEDSLRLPHQAIVEFIAAVTRPLGGYTILPQLDALREAEEFLKQFTVLKDEVLAELMAEHVALKKEIGEL